MSNCQYVLRYFIEVVRGLLWVPPPFGETYVLDHGGKRGVEFVAWTPLHGPEPTVAEVMAHEADWLAWKAAQDVAIAEAAAPFDEAKVSPGTLAVLNGPWTLAKLTLIRKLVKRG